MFSCFCLNMLLMFALELEASVLRIFGGRDAYPDEYPYVVGIYVVGQNNTVLPMCTASVLTSTWTLTAAHCIVGSFVLSTQMQVGNLESAKQIIRYGSPDGKPSPEDKFSDVLRTVEFPSHRAVWLTFEDVGLLKTQPILLKRYAKISALPYTTVYGHEVTMVGYGVTNNTMNQIDATFYLDKPMQVAKGMIKQCDKNNKYNSYPSICVVPSCAHASWVSSGDSGGPVLHPSGIIAVTSRIKYPQHGKHNFVLIRESDIVTPLSPYIDWITRTIRNIDET